MSKRVCPGRITSPFGMRHDPINHLWTMHNGVDISAPIGTPVYAPADGVVETITNNPLGGKTLILSSEGRRFGFCHLSYFALAQGDSVKRGQLVARTGTTGRTTGPHLHFSVMESGKYFDPEPFIDLAECAPL